MTDDLAPLGRLALTAARAGAEVVRGVDRDAVVARFKSSHRDIVTEIDTAAEHAVIDTIQRVMPEAPILGEEGGTHAGTGDVRWIIDPIDGTANFVRGRPDHAVAVAAETGEGLVAAAVVKPMTGEWMVCDEAGKAMSDAGLPSVSDRRELSRSLISLSVSVDPARRPITQSTLLRLLREVQDFRRTGSTSCDLFDVARGRLDAYIGIGSNPWDIAPGWALVHAAGGSCQRFGVADGHDAYVMATPALAGNLRAIITDHVAAQVVAPAVSRARTSTRERPASPPRRRPGPAIDTGKGR